MEIVFITSNKSKFNFAKEILKKYNIKVVRKDMHILERRSDDVNDVVRYKIKDISKHLRKHLMAEDSGLYIDGLNGFPGTLMKIFLRYIGINGILKLLENNDNRKAMLRSALCYYNLNTGKTRLFVSDLKGKISENIRGDYTRGWSDIMKIFIPHGFNKTMAEMNDTEWENLISKENNFDMLGRALRKRLLI